MIVILADDFSGAAELAGIAAAKGYRAEVQTLFDPESEAEVVAIDSDTRMRHPQEAATTVGKIAREVAHYEPEWIFKKTDSVLRGHVRLEIEAILSSGEKSNCLLVPANPSKGRVIRNEHYFIDGIPLNETIFAHDPSFPAGSSRVGELLGFSDRIQIPDIGSVDDIPKMVHDETLPAGGADFFSALLELRRPTTRRESCSRTLLVCGSLAAWDSGRASEMAKRGFIVRSIEEGCCMDVWESYDRVMLTTGSKVENDGDALVETLIELAAEMSVDAGELRIALEGGATAKAFLRKMGWTRFPVLPENHVGVGSLRPPGGPVICVKPGSYPWPDTLFSN